MELVLGMLFLLFNHAKVNFIKVGKLTWNSYIVVETLSITSLIELINKREFVKVALDKNFKTFVMLIFALEIPTMIPIYLSKTS